LSQCWNILHKITWEEMPGIETLGLCEHNFTDEDITPLNKKIQWIVQNW